MCARMGGGEGGMKAINIQRLGEREEGGQRGTEDGILLLCVLHPVFLYHSTTCLFILFIYLSFLCSLNHPHIWFGPPTPSTPLHAHTPTLTNPTAAALQCSFLAPSLLLVVAPYVRGAPYR